MTDTQRLLAEYARHGSEAAFRELVARYLDLVHSTAIRLVGHDAHLAEDVAQIVFMDLARMADSLSGEVLLGGWLHRHTCFVAAKTLRGERRRQSRERQTVEMNALHDHTEANLAQITPLLDEAIDQLGAEDRAAIMLRFFERLDFRSVGTALGTNEAAAQKRVARALEKLHLLLTRRGLAFSVAAVGTALAAQAVCAAPAELAVRISAAAVAGAASSGGALFTLLKIMSMTKFQIGLASVLIASAGVTLVIQRQAQLKLEETNQTLRRQITQLQSNQEMVKLQLAKPPRQIAARPALAAGDIQTPHPADLLKRDKPVKLTREQVEAYLKANGRNAASLLAAFRASDDPALLQEAMAKFPTDPRVDLAAIFKTGSSTGEERQWLNAFAQSAPGNSLANYLSALNYFQSGQSDLAVQELGTASGKLQFENYAQEAGQSDIEAYLAAGYSMADAKVIGPTINPQTPMNNALKELGQDMVGLAAGYQQSGDQTSAQAALQMTVNLGQLLNTPDQSAAVTKLVGMNIEMIAFNAMDSASPYGNTSQTVQDQINQLAQQRTALMELGAQFNSVAATMSDQDWINYRDREWAFGQTAAQQWAINKYGPE